MINYEYADNFRFAFLDDDYSMSKYEKQQERGCCGSMDSIIAINDRRAMIGCNHGH